MMGQNGVAANVEAVISAAEAWQIKKKRGTFGHRA